VHPFITIALIEARQADLERAARLPYRGPEARAQRRPRPPARVAVGMRLIELGLRLVDIAPASPAC